MEPESEESRKPERAEPPMLATDLTTLSVPQMTLLAVSSVYLNTLVVSGFGV